MDIIQRHNVSSTIPLIAWIFDVVSLGLGFCAYDPLVRALAAAIPLPVGGDEELPE